MNRREVMASALALPALGAVAAEAAHTDSPLRAIYHKWQAAKDTYNNSGLSEDDPREEALFAAIVHCEQAAAAFVPKTAEDYAWKIIFADDDGMMNSTVPQLALARQAYEIAGVPPRSAGGYIEL